MGWGIGVSAGPLYCSKRLGGRRRSSSDGSGWGAALVVLILLGLAIKFWYVVVPAVAVMVGLWLIGKRGEADGPKS
jgi:hypothetical protein